MKSEKIYLFNFISSSIFGFIPVVVMLFVWNAVFNSGGKVSDLDSYHIVTYYFFSYITASLVNATAIARDISMDIRTGTINNVLLKPVSYMQYVFHRHLGQKSFLCLVLVIPASVFYLVFRNHITIYFSRIILFAGALVLAFILNFLLYYLIGILSFWFMDNGGLIQLWSNLLSITSGERFPLFLFPASIQLILGFFPFKYTVYFPVSIMVEPQVAYGNFGVMLLWIIVLGGIVKLLWNKGCEMNEGVGI